MNSKRTRKNQIMLSAVALLVIFMVAVSVTYSWIEGGTTYSIQSDELEDNSVKTAALPNNLSYNGKITLNPDTTSTELELVKYDETSNQYQDLCFSPVSSADGKNFFFPIGDEGVTAYREATTNDIGTKFISFDFDIQTTAAQTYLAFNGTPTITAKLGTTTYDTSAFRVMLSNSAGKSYIFSTSTTALSDNAVTDVDGTRSTAQSTKIFSDYNYSNGSNRLFSYPDSGTSDTITVSIWLDADSNYSELIGTNIAIDLKLYVGQEKIKATFDAVTYDNSGNPTDSSFTGGKITVGSTTYSTSESIDYVVGSTVTATATANTYYTFGGWYTDKDCKELVSTVSNGVYSTSLSHKPDSNITYYAKFVEMPKHTVTVSAVTTPSGTGGTATVNGSSSVTDYEGVELTLLATPNSGYRFVGWYTDSSYSTLYSSDKETKATISEDITYYAVFEEYLSRTIYFQPSSNWTKDSAWFAGWVWGGVADSQWCIFTDDDGDGIYSAEIPEDCTGIKFVRMNPSYTEPSFDTGKWNESGDITIDTTGKNLFIPTTDWGFTGGTWYYYPVTVNVAVNNSSYGTATVDGSSSVVTYSGDTVTITATAKSGYGFVGWYTNSACTTTIGSNYATASQDITVSGTADSSVTYYAKFAKAYTAKAVAVTDGTSSSSTGGTVQVTGGTAGATSSASVASGTSVTFTAVAKSGYEFTGWYTSASSTTATSKSLSYKVSITAAKTMYAKFVKSATIIYFTPSDTWESENSPRYAMYVFNDTTSTNAWVSMTEIGTSNVFQAELPEGTWEGIIFCRMNPSTTTNSWSNKWNQTGDLTIPTDGSNYFVFTSTTWDGGKTGTWTTYSEE